MVARGGKSVVVPRRLSVSYNGNKPLGIKSGGKEGRRKSGP